MSIELIIDKLKVQKEFLSKQDPSIVEQIIDDIVKSNFGSRSWEERQEIKDRLHQEIIF